MSLNAGVTAIVQTFQDLANSRVHPPRLRNRRLGCRHPSVRHHPIAREREQQSSSTCDESSVAGMRVFCRRG